MESAQVAPQTQLQQDADRESVDSKKNPEDDHESANEEKSDELKPTEEHQDGIEADASADNNDKSEDRVSEYANALEGKSSTPQQHHDPSEPGMLS